YVQEHAQVLRSDLIAMANDLDRARTLFDADRERYRRFLTAQAAARAVAKAALLTRQGEVILEAETPLARELRLPPLSAIGDAVSGDPILIAPGSANQVGGVLKLQSFEDTYLYVARPVDPQVSAYLRLTEQNAAEYASLEARRLGV